MSDAPRWALLERNLKRKKKELLNALQKAWKCLMKNVIKQETCKHVDGIDERAHEIKGQYN